MVCREESKKGVLLGLHKGLIKKIFSFKYNVFLCDEKRCWNMEEYLSKDRKLLGH